MRGLVVALVAAGCYNPTIHNGVPCGPGDACPGGQACIAGICDGTGDIDASLFDSVGIDGSSACGWSPEHFDACSIPPPQADLVLDITNGTYSWDTDTGELKKGNNVISVTTMVVTQTNGPSVRMALVNNFTLLANVDLNIVGSRPLLIAAWGTATIAGFIELSASTSTAGPGGSLTTYCTGSTGTNGLAATPAKGAGGGSFQGKGGTGGNTGGAGGAQVAVSSIIRGGCSGGLGPAGGSSGPRGAGGGAIQITAKQSITVASTGAIHAGGGGGGSGRYNSVTLTTGGAGGGGSGGYIGLDAPTVSVAGSITANGGGGGGGSSDVANGLAGANGRSDAIAASGGPGASSSNLGACVPGGSGAAAASLNGVSAGTSGCGGSGGGGGAGYIYVWSPSYSATGTVSPTRTVGP